MRYGLVLVAAWIAIVPAIPAQAQESGGKADLAKAQQIVNTVCAACHGADGNSPTPVNPSLAGQLGALPLAHSLNPSGSAARGCARRPERRSIAG